MKTELDRLYQELKASELGKAADTTIEQHPQGFADFYWDGEGDIMTDGCVVVSWKNRRRLAAASIVGGECRALCCERDEPDDILGTVPNIEEAIVLFNEFVFNGIQKARGKFRRIGGR